MTTSQTTPATAVLIHGAWHGPWCWDKVVTGLEARGVPTLCVDRRRGDPLRGADDLDENEQLVRDQIAEIDGPIVMMGHSFAGNVMTVAPLGDDRIKHLVFLAAMMPDAQGEYPPGLVAQELIEAIEPVDETSVTVREDAQRAIFYGQCSDEDVAMAQAALVPDDAHGPTSKIPRALAYEQIPSTFVVCTDDHALLPDPQRVQAKRLDTVVEWSTDHSPFFSRPELVIDLMDRLARQYGE